jgi:hypothetical protein
MKFCKAGFLLALLAAVCFPAVAQDPIQLNVPFNFFAAGKSLPAGHYRVERLFDGDMAAWGLVNDKGHPTVVLTNSVQSPKTEHPPSLVFRTTGTTYSLIQIWTTEHFGRDLPLRETVKTTLIAETEKYVMIEAK